MNEGIKVGDTVNDRVITKLELDSAKRLGIDVKLVKEDTINKTGVLMIITDLESTRKYLGSHKSWSPKFFAVGTTCKDDKGNNQTVPMSGSGYNPFGAGVKTTTKTGVL